ncbi:hypothetical protein V1512DRAFT_229474 [Lipomyces arxii]|uniref:uncharacterized protein n=1 Tax=Lipomyces arxii TaxID=56418 RepID=UPI0034CE2096
MFDEPHVSELRNWLTSRLENLTDADSEILADYVLALLRHEQSEEDAMRMCREQLEDFLHSNTAGFVDEVFGVLKTKQYLLSSASIANDTQELILPYEGNTRERCRDYDEKGYCMKGDLCPYQHGEERIIVSTGNRGRGRGRDRGRERERERGPRFVHGSRRDPSNATLVVKKIPVPFTEAQIVQEFSQFGNIMRLNIYPTTGSAVITFATPEQANLAYSSPVAYFGNRFVKVFWSNSEAESTVRSRRRSASPGIPIEEIVRRQSERQREFEEREARRRQHEEQLAQMKLRAAEQEQEKRALMLKIASAAAASTEGMTGTEVLKAKLAQLKAEADALGVTEQDYAQSRYQGNYRGAYRGASRGFYRGSVRGSARGVRGGYGGYGGRGGTVDRSKYKLDLRTTRVAVHNLDENKTEDLASHLLSLGEYQSIDQMGTDKLVTFKDRVTAERFMSGGHAMFGDDVSYSWYNATPAPVEPAYIAAPKQQPMEDDDEAEYRRQNEMQSEMPQTILQTEIDEMDQDVY